MTRSGTTKDSRSRRSATRGFGVPETLDPHHYIVRIPRSRKRSVLVTENVGAGAEDLSVSVIDRAVLPRDTWDSISGPLQRDLNARLRRQGITTSRWKVGDNPVDRLLGKEICVLAWAVEEAPHDRVANAVQNWLALRPEDRWWLFSMTAAATGGPGDAGVGWRAALRHALAEAPRPEITATRSDGRPAGRTTADEAQSGSLFETQETSR